MILKTKNGNILKGTQKRIAFAVNTEGTNDTGFSGMISSKYWPELANIGETKLGTVLTKKVKRFEFFALCCYSLEEGWNNQKEIIKECFDAIPGDKTVASISIGSGLSGILSGADPDLVREGMEVSKKGIILY